MSKSTIFLLLILFLSATCIAGETQKTKWLLIASEDFETFAPDKLPWPRKTDLPSPPSGGWGYNSKGPYSLSFAENNAPETRGRHCLEISDGSEKNKKNENGFAFLSFGIPWKSPENIEAVKVSFDWKTSYNSGNWYFVGMPYYEGNFSNPAGTSLNFATCSSREYKDYICAIGNSYKETACAKSLPDTWYHATIIYKRPFGSYSLYLQNGNDIQSFENLPFGNGNIYRDLPPDFFLFGTWAYSAKGSISFDNITVEYQSSNSQKESEKEYINVQKPRTITSLFAAKAPAIDGTLDDAIWQNVTPAKDFCPWNSKEKITQQTEVYTTWDNNNLYIAYRNHEKNMGKLRASKYSPDPESRDQASWVDDIVELFIQPAGCSHYAQFAVSATGATWDYSDINKEMFTPAWSVAVKKYDDCWIAEIAIPWSSLSLLANPFHPPLNGELWGINFIRNEKPSKELSSWAPPTKKGFHDPANFGQLIFSKDKSDISIEQLSETGNMQGKSSFSISVKNSQNTDEVLKSEFTVLGKDGNKVSKNVHSLKKNSEEKWTIPYDLEIGQQWKFKIYKQETLIFWLEGQSELSNKNLAEKMINSLRQEFKNGFSELNLLPEDKNRRLYSKLSELNKTLEDIASKSEAGQTDAAETVRTIESFSRDHSIKGSLGLIKLLTQDIKKYQSSSISKGYVVTAENSLEKLFPESAASHLAADGATLECASNEGESFQLQVIAPWEDLQNCEVTFSDLKCGGNILPASVFQATQVGFIHTSHDIVASAGTGNDRNWYPDPLVPLSPFKVKTGSSKILWVSIYIPKNTVPGIYAGNITIKPENKEMTICPVTVRVFNFSLPDKSSLLFFSWLGISPNGIDLRNLKDYEDTQSRLYKYRISAEPVFNTLSKQVKISEPQPGKYAFDFSELDQFLSIGFKYSLQSFNIAFNPNDAWRRLCIWGNGDGFLEIHQPDGSIKKMDVRCEGVPLFGPEWPWKYRAPVYEGGPRADIYAQCIRAYVEHLKNKGWYKAGHLESIDEPSNNMADFYEKYYRYLKKLVPDLPLFSFDAGPKKFNNMIGINTRWAPQLCRIPPELPVMKKRKVTNPEEEMCTYVCGDVAKSRSSFTPDIFVWQPNIARRILPWMCWEWKLDSFLAFTLGTGTDLNKFHPINLEWNPYTFETKSIDRVEVFHLLWPYKNNSNRWDWIPSIRMESYRDGVEDYEYLNILKGLSNTLKMDKTISDTKKASLLQQADKLLDISRFIPDGDVYEWNNDYNNYLKIRKETGNLIEKINTLLSEKAQSK